MSVLQKKKKQENRQEQAEEASSQSVSGTGKIIWPVSSSRAFMEFRGLLNTKSAKSDFNYLQAKCKRLPLGL